MVLIMGTMVLFYSVKDKIRLPFVSHKKIGIVNIEGTIFSSRNVLDWLNKLKKDPDVVGILIRINSPGGVVAPSQEIYEAVKEINKVKPVVVSMGAVAASGAYYISCGARKIIANPGTITGSIGVLAKLTCIKKLLDKVGVEDETITSGKFKDAGSPFKELTPDQKKYFQDLVKDLYNQFITAVAQGRHMDLNKVKKLADGRVYTGRQAKDLGLVDYLGNMDKAIDILKNICHIKGEVGFVEGPEKKRSLIQRIVGAIAKKDLLLKNTGLFFYIIPSQFSR